MAQAGVIRDFMVALGFKTDNSGLKQMQDAMSGVELKAAALKGALMALATGAVIAVRQTASELDKLYFSSQRIGASATNITAFGNAISQMGGNAESALGTLEGIAEKMRNSPGYEGMLNGLGVSTKEANGEMRDRVEVMKDLSGVLSQMPAYQANAYAQSLGIDQNTLLAMRDGKFLQNMEKYQKIQKELGMNDDLTKSGNEFMTEYRDLTMMTKTGFQVIVMQAGKALIPILRLLNQLIRAGITTFSQMNPQIKEMLGQSLRFGMAALMLGGVVRIFVLLLRLISPLRMFIGLIKLLWITLLASPVGVVLALVAAIGLLWDDYKKWKEGGKSFIDWKNWTKEADWVIDKIKELIGWIQNLAKTVIDWGFGKGSFDSVVDGVSRYIIEPFMENFNKENGNSNPNSTSASSTANTKPVGQTEIARKAAEGIARIMNDGAKKAASVYTFSFGKDVDKYITESSVKYGIDEKVLRGFVKMEDGWTGKMSPSGAIGTGQFTQGTWNGLAKTKAGKEIGMTKIDKSNFRKANDPRYDKRINTLATGLLAKQNADILRKNGLPVTGENLYMLHNIGPGVIPVLKGEKKVNTDTLNAMKLNGMVKGMSSAQFVEFQKTRFNKHYQMANKEGDLSIGNTNTSINSIAPPSGNPHKSQTNNASNMSASNITIHQTYQTDMTINGARDPVESAKAVKRQQENSMTVMARGAQGVMV